MAKKNEDATGDLYELEPIKGYPMLHWQGKRPFQSTQYYPAQLKEEHGKPVNEWMNEIYWGDNLQVMSHLLKTCRGKVQLICIDPPYDSKADYKKKIELKGQKVANDYTGFEEKQYGDIWTNDEYLQFMYERLILMRELLSDDGSIYLHCDWHKVHYLRNIMDEVFGQNNFVNEIIWQRKQAQAWSSNQFGITNDTLLLYSKTGNHVFNTSYSKDDDNTKRYIKERFVFDGGDGRKYMKSPLVNPLNRPNLRYEFHGVKPPETGWLYSQQRMENMYKNGELVIPENKHGRIYRKIFADEYKGQLIQNIWTDIPIVNPMAKERLDYPTQKPEALLERIIKTSSNPGGIILDVFMGSGTTQAVAMKLGRRFIGADINLGAIQTTTKRLLNVAAELKDGKLDLKGDGIETFYTGFSVYNVNHYDFFKSPVEAKELLMDAYEIQPLPSSSLYDGELDGWMVKIMPVNRIATRLDLNDLISNFDRKSFDKRRKESPGKPVERVLLICMGHELDLAAELIKQMKTEGYEIDVRVVDVLREKAKLEFKRDSEARIVMKKGELVIESFYPMNLLQKLSLEKKEIKDWRELTESVMIDWNYNGKVFSPTTVDVPDGKELVGAKYTIPADADTIRVKITDLLSESCEVVVNA